jgi:hypothetical protein
MISRGILCRLVMKGIMDIQAIELTRDTNKPMVLVDMVSTLAAQPEACAMLGARCQRMWADLLTNTWPRHPRTACA